MAIHMPYGLVIMILFLIIHTWLTGYFLTKQCGFNVLRRSLVGTYSPNHGCKSNKNY